MIIKVLCNNENVFKGTLEQFLLDNDNEEWLVNECNNLRNNNKIEFNEISGNWIIEKI
jgi:hypothetical protein